MAGRTFKVAGRDILVDVGHANQWLVQFLYILGVQFDGELVTGEYGLSGGGDVFAVAVDIHDYAMVGKFERIGRNRLRPSLPRPKSAASAHGRPVC